MKKPKCVHLCFRYSALNSVYADSWSFVVLKARPSAENQTGLHLPPTSSVPPILNQNVMFLDGGRKVLSTYKAQKPKKLQNCPSLFSWLYTQQMLAGQRRLSTQPTCLLVLCAQRFIEHSFHESSLLLRWAFSVTVTPFGSLKHL